MEIAKLSSYKKHIENPFLAKAVQEIDGGLVKKYRSSTGYDQKAVLQAVDPKTGEVLGHTTFIRQMEVDENKFTKLYLSHFSAFFDLKTQAIRIFGYIINQLKPSQDMIIFFMDDCLSYTGYKTKKPVYEGLAQLLAAEIIARGRTDSIYFVNPLIAFNGNRITFAKSYIKRKIKANSNQTDLFQAQEKKFEKKIEGIKKLSDRIES